LLLTERVCKAPRLPKKLAVRFVIELLVMFNVCRVDATGANSASNGSLSLLLPRLSVVRVDDWIASSAMLVN